MSQFIGAFECRFYVCNFRFTYCLPDGYRPQGTPDTCFLTLIIAAWRADPVIRTVAVTTNGYRLARDVAAWRATGLTALNVSVDSLDARQFQAITGQHKFHQVMAGI